MLDVTLEVLMAHFLFLQLFKNVHVSSNNEAQLSRGLRQESIPAVLPFSSVFWGQLGSPSDLPPSVCEIGWQTPAWLLTRLPSAGVRQCL